MTWILIAVAMVLLDQASKYACAQWLTGLPSNTYPLWPGVFHLTYIENRGAAFSMLQNGRWFFVAITFAACVGIVWFLMKERGRMHALMKVTLALILGGAIGNMIDRILLGYVRDMFYVVAVNFAIFNVADSAVSVGCGILALDLLFFKGTKYLEDKPGQEPEARK